MFPPATPGSPLYEHPDVGTAYPRVSPCLYKLFIHLSPYLPAFIYCFSGNNRLIRRYKHDGMIDKHDR